MSRSNLSPAAHKINRVLRNAKRATANDSHLVHEPLRYANDSIDDDISYQFSSSFSYENDSMCERDFSISLDL